MLLLFQPGLAIGLLAFRAMAVATGMVAVLDLLAIWADENPPAQGCGAARFNCPHGLQVVGRDAIRVLLSIGRSRLAKNIGQFYGHKRPTTSLIA